MAIQMYDAENVEFKSWLRRHLNQHNAEPPGLNQR